MKKNNFKLILVLILMSCLLATTVYAASPIIDAAIVKYSYAKSGSSYGNVQSALDDLYDKVNGLNNTNVCSSTVAKPNLGNDLIPVTISDDGTVKYADTNKSWYDYCNRIWANAVILVDGVSYKVGDTIKESDIESYFVWIPKYKYKLWNVNTTTTTKVGYRTIDIVFDTEDTKDIDGVSCKTPMNSGESGNCDDGEYMTHPAFISLGSNGFWVGKFETGYNGATSAASAEVDAIDTSKIIIKPNVYSWRSIKTYNAFMNSYNYKTNLNSHMMKNTEWGAVAYLSHSEYGINTEVYINNNSSYLTGYGSNGAQNDFPGTYGSDSSLTQAYNTTLGYKASTTGNISGIYDMSGGAWEYMASYLSGNIGSSDFEDITNSAYLKYLDVYTSSSFTGRILGDATGEMAPFSTYKSESGNSYTANKWYASLSHFVSNISPWFARGGDYNNGVLAGQFYFSSSTGDIYGFPTYRIILSP